MSVKWSGDEFLAKLKSANDKAVTGMAIELENRIRDGFGRSHGGVRSKPGEFPHSQLGDLRNSMGHTRAVDGVSWVGSGVPYARYLNDGAIIKPRNRKHLAIPLTERAQREARRHNGSAKDAINAMGCKARRPLKDKTGWLLGFQRARKGFEPHWLISSKTRVLLPRPWAKLGIAAATEAMTARYVDTMRKAMR